MSRRQNASDAEVPGGSLIRRLFRRLAWGLAGTLAVVFGFFVLAYCLTSNVTRPTAETAAYNAQRDLEAWLGGPGPPITTGGREDCDAAPPTAAAINAASLLTLPWSPFGRAETGWAVYEPLVANTIGTRCPGRSAGFARALSAWQMRRGLPPDGRMTSETFARMRVELQRQRPVVRLAGVCPEPPPEASLATGSAADGYAGTVVRLRPGALAAYRRMAEAARAADPAIAADPRYLTIFSSFRSPAYDAMRCERDLNCNGVTRAVCSPHRTGLAMDIYMGQAPGYGPDSTADPNRLAMTRGPAYRWMLQHAGEYGFVNYPFEPWHWEWTGERP